MGFLSAVVLATIITTLPITLSFSISLQRRLQTQTRTKLFQSNTDDDDWRDFRAKLINPTKNSSSYCYDAGFLIEKGSIVLSRVESKLGCHDLRQPYFHKCAVLVLDHDDSGFTRGIVLNRPTNLYIPDVDIIDMCSVEEIKWGENENRITNRTWRMHFGGDISGLFDEEPQIVCLHSIKTELGRKFSDTVLRSMYISDHEGATMLMDAGEATPEDFFVFYGFCLWEPGQLEKELKRGSWSMVAVDACTLLGELTNQRKNIDPRRGGLDMWRKLTNRISKDIALSTFEKDSFTDLMLKEWSLEMLYIPTEEDMDDWNDSIVARDFDNSQPIEAGTMVRGSSLDLSPFLLDEQLFHKSTVLIFQEKEEFSVGLILNHPTALIYTLVTPDGKDVEFNIRYGGPNGVEGEDPPIWLHASETLRGLRFGTPFQGNALIYTCTPLEVGKAVDRGLALPTEFMLIQGFTMWEKEEGFGGIYGQVMTGNFEVISASSQVERAWSILLQQELLLEKSLNENIVCSIEAWGALGKEKDEDVEQKSSIRERLVFGSKTKVRDLADEALKNWVKIFLLGDAEYASF
mmetsp:Transcript_50805/g.99331  ORF Transcript_50805/g.99331 Transcript_50805/m.99331 type:complete len:575 (-) Transcript_50805:137-1861(-)|eukprot:CAMPEP_0194327558 /NCGR_PEP_ID=MMETSP0171-20130528/41592_1 /TAXON_ID=218684 /ORGANISM="Corethron pennatum, Strain L29A3" /LENGTH=574 /DNA_ID=CAMNT_0039087553 /DNA_START=60 /DNA_END=1784 /DNA_ORIENTATION=-